MISISKLNETYLRLTSDDSRVLSKIYEHFKVPIEGAEFTPRFKMGIWDGKISAFNKTNGTLPLGLWKSLIEYLKSNNIQFTFSNFNAKELFTNPVFPEELVKLYIQKHLNLPFDMYYYQEEAAIAALQYQKATLLMATGAGKSAVIYLLMRILYQMNEADKVILIVPSVGLVEQMKGNMVDDYGWKHFDTMAYTLNKDTPKKEKDAIFNPNGMDRPFLITTWQSVQKRPQSFFEQFNAIIIDEVHGVTESGKVLANIAKLSYGAKYKIGLTGTLGENEADKQAVLGFMGPIVYKVKSKLLMDLGVLSPIDIKNIICRYPTKVQKMVTGASYDQEVKIIEEYEPRNIVISDIIRNNPNDNTLLLVKHHDHLEMVKEHLDYHFGNTHTIEIIHGKISAKKREEIRVTMNKSRNYILLATFASAGTGMNIPNIDHVIFAASYKSKIKVLQSIGRGLRKADGKEKMTLWDIVDDFSTIQGTGRRVKKNSVYKHFEQRLEYYIDQEFDFENIEKELSE